MGEWAKRRCPADAPLIGGAKTSARRGLILLPGLSAPGLSRAVRVASPHCCFQIHMVGFATILGCWRPHGTAQIRRGLNALRWQHPRRAEIFAPPIFAPPIRVESAEHRPFAVSPSRPYAAPFA